MEYERPPVRRVRAEQHLELILRVSRSVLETDVWGVAATVARAGAELVGAQQASVGLVDRAGTSWSGTAAGSG